LRLKQDNKKLFQSLYANIPGEYEMKHLLQLAVGLSLLASLPVLQWAMQMPDKAKQPFVQPAMALMATAQFRTGPSWAVSIPHILSAR
jgi:hypothetical protein